MLLVYSMIVTYHETIDCSKLEVPSVHDQTPSTKSASRSRHRGRKTDDTRDHTDTEVSFKTESAAVMSPSRSRQSSPRRSPQKRGRSALDDDDGRGPVQHSGRKRQRQPSKDTRQTQVVVKCHG